MIHSLEEFLHWWTTEAVNTAELFAAIHDEELSKRLIPNEKTLGELAWYLLETPRDLLGRAGLEIEGPRKGSLPPKTMQEIVDEQGRVAKSVLNVVSEKWTGKNLDKTVDINGEQWRRRDVLFALLLHHIHYRGQLSMLLRVANCDFKPIYKL